MLTAYFDETGHSHDEKQKFNGMAGLLCKAEEWEKFEERWDRLLKKFKIPYIHMAKSMSTSVCEKRSPVSRQTSHIELVTTISKLIANKHDIDSQVLVDLLKLARMECHKVRLTGRYL